MCDRTYAVHLASIERQSINQLFNVTLVRRDQWGLSIPLSIQDFLPQQAHSITIRLLDYLEVKFVMPGKLGLLYIFALHIFTAACAACTFVLVLRFPHLTTISIYQPLIQ